MLDDIRALVSVTILIFAVGRICVGVETYESTVSLSDCVGCHFLKEFHSGWRRKTARSANRWQKTLEAFTDYPLPSCRISGQPLKSLWDQSVRRLA